jgi:hypothetical protein
MVPLILISLVAAAQKSREISVVAVLEKALFSGQETLTFENTLITDPGSKNLPDTVTDLDNLLYYLLIQKHGSKIKLDSDKNIIVPASLSFQHCTFYNTIFSRFNFRNVTFYSCTFKDQLNVHDEDFENSILEISNCVFSGAVSCAKIKVENVYISNTKFLSDLFIYNSSIGIHQADSSFQIENCSIQGQAVIANNHLSGLYISGCSFHDHTRIDKNFNGDDYLVLRLVGDKFFPLKKRVTVKTTVPGLPEFSPVFQFSLQSNKRCATEILDCTLYRDQGYQLAFVGADDDDGGILIENSRIESFLIFVGKFGYLKLRNTHLERVDFGGSQLPEKNDYTWSDIKGKGFFALFVGLGKAVGVSHRDSAVLFRQMHGLPVPFPYYGKSAAELSNEHSFNVFHASLYRLYQMFKANGDLTSSNQSYIYIKDLEGDYLYNQLKNGFSMKTLISFSLNRLIKVYTAHGTDPAKAIVVSIYIILAFSLVYFAFPSDWNGNLHFSFAEIRKSVSGLKDQKVNYHLLLRRSSTLLSGWFHSFMLSVNSFVTLGFGEIPTKGLVRNLCIIEGFIGWFLLSIFVVALINQTLF